MAEAVVAVPCLHGWLVFNWSANVVPQTRPRRVNAMPACARLANREAIDMQIATGTVVNGRIVLDGVALTEGAVVAVVTRGADESFTLTQDEEDELLAAMAEIEAGEYVTLDRLLQSLPKRA